MRLCTFFAAVLLTAVSSTSTVSNHSDSAWNGVVTMDPTTPGPFTPYYVPPGSRVYDSNSPFIHYSGRWFDALSPEFVGKSLRRTHWARSAVKLTFKGTGIEWFACTDAMHGIAEVFIDGELVASVDGYSDKKRRRQRLFSTSHLPYGKHTIKIINTGKKNKRSSHHVLDIDAFVVAIHHPRLYKHAAPPYQAEPEFDFRVLSISSNASKTPEWSLSQHGTTGVHAMQLAVISKTHALIIDKVEHNPLTIDGHPAWAGLYNLDTDEVRPLRIQSNSFCAGGSFTGNGTLVNIGGNPIVTDSTGAADFGDADGLQAVRVLEPCDESPDECVLYEHHERLRLASPRWYNTIIRINDGSILIIGGSTKGGWMNNATTNNPTIEYFPPKGIHDSAGLPITLPFLVDTLNSNLFPIAFSLCDGKAFIAANQDAMIYDWQTNTERRLPRIPNGVRVTYPMTGTGVLLPLSPENGYTPEVLLCGGSTVDDRKPGYAISSQEPASAQCSRITLTDAGIAQGWTFEHMPQARTMADAVLLPTGHVLLVNGAGSGIAGYGNVRDQIGASNADNAVLTPVLYNPTAPAGQRFSSEGMPRSAIPRLYHSVATLTPKGSIMVAGSNPNLDRSNIDYETEYRVEWLEPPYMKLERPRIVRSPVKMGFGKMVELTIVLPGPQPMQGNIKGCYSSSLSMRSLPHTIY
jgi:hypothetical protein